MTGPDLGDHGTGILGFIAGAAFTAICFGAASLARAIRKEQRQTTKGGSMPKPEKDPKDKPDEAQRGPADDGVGNPPPPPPPPPPAGG